MHGATDVKEKNHLRIIQKKQKGRGRTETVELLYKQQQQQQQKQQDNNSSSNNNNKKKQQQLLQQPQCHRNRNQERIGDEELRSILEPDDKHLEVGIRFELSSPERLEEIWEFLSEEFLPDEPVMRSELAQRLFVI